LVKTGSGSVNVVGETPFLIAIIVSASLCKRLYSLPLLGLLAERPFTVVPLNASLVPDANAGVPDDRPGRHGATALHSAAD
jgi:hypothetical protein